MYLHWLDNMLVCFSFSKMETSDHFNKSHINEILGILQTSVMKNKIGRFNFQRKALTKTNDYFHTKSTWKLCADCSYFENQYKYNFRLTWQKHLFEYSLRKMCY